MTTDIETLKVQLRKAAGAGQFNRAAARLLLETAPTMATAAFLTGAARRSGDPSLLARRLVILRNWTIEPLLPVLEALAAVHGMALRIEVGGYGDQGHDIFDNTGLIASAAPDAVLLADYAQAAVPALWTEADALSGTEATALADAAIDRLQGMLTGLRQRTGAPVLIQSLAPAGDNRLSGDGRDTFIRQINQGWQQALAEHPACYMFDSQAVAGAVTQSGWYDARRWAEARMPYATAALFPLAAAFYRALHPLLTAPVKLVVLDLDGTLWHGTLGEDGADGIRMDSEHPGAPFRDLQRLLKYLASRGLLLAVCSKNNASDAMPVLERHADMLLRPADLTACRIDWEPKPDNLARIVRELNIGFDAVLFLDDSPLERALMRQALPDVIVPELAADPYVRLRQIRDLPCLNRLPATLEDRARANNYQAESQRRSASQGLDMDSFLSTLDLRLSITSLSAQNVARAAQLCGKTNQFNLTTLRQSEADLVDYATAPGRTVWLVRAEDRFGDYGWIGLAQMHAGPAGLCIDNLLISCRALGRGVETALLADLAWKGREAGYHRLELHYIPSGRNMPAGRFLVEAGLQAPNTHDGVGAWLLDLTGALPVWPTWITRIGPPPSLLSTGAP